MKSLILRECSDCDVIYGVIVVGDEIDVEEIQNKIYEIKKEFHATGFEDWIIEDVLEKLSESHEFNYSPLDGSVEI